MVLLRNHSNRIIQERFIHSNEYVVEFGEGGWGIGVISHFCA
jgi:hypothetical protein